MKPSCKKCWNCGKTQDHNVGLHKGGPRGNKVYAVAVCNHTNGCRREIPSTQIMPAWCPGYQAQ
jgi:hypothetical protein